MNLISHTCLISFFSINALSAQNGMLPSDVGIDGKLTEVPTKIVLPFTPDKPNSRKKQSTVSTLAHTAVDLPAVDASVKLIVNTSDHAVSDAAIDRMHVPAGTELKVISDNPAEIILPISNTLIKK